MMWRRGDAIPADWPEWLKEARIGWCEVEIKNGTVTWHGGEWFDGIWFDGVWRGGVWRGGTWLDGTWHSGVWLGGMWFDGEWRNGAWYGGRWYDGVWRNGIATARSRYIPVLLARGRIRIGCKIKPREEWDSWFAGAEQYDTPRGTEAFAMIEAHYRALCAYIDCMSAFEEKR